MNEIAFQDLMAELINENLDTKKFKAYKGKPILYELKVASDNMKMNNYATTAFYCQQSVEKLLKAVIIIRRKTEPPKTHSLRILINTLNITEKNLVDNCLQLTPHYFSGKIS